MTPRQNPGKNTGPGFLRLNFPLLSMFSVIVLVVIAMDT